MPAQQNYVVLLEARNRQARITTQGSEIVITWYCEPATAAPIVISQLIGSVTGNNANGVTTDHRYLPASDYQYPFCYCVSAREQPLDARSLTSGPNMSNRAPALSDIDMTGDAINAPIVFDGPLSLDSDGNYIPLPEASEKRGRCGAWIEAIYRPLYSVYNFPTNGDPSNRLHQFV